MDSSTKISGLRNMQPSFSSNGAGSSHHSHGNGAVDFPIDVDVARSMSEQKPETLHSSLPKLARRIGTTASTAAADTSPDASAAPVALMPHNASPSASAGVTAGAASGRSNASSTSNVTPTRPTSMGRARRPSVSMMTVTTETGEVVKQVVVDMDNGASAGAGAGAGAGGRSGSFDEDITFSSSTNGGDASNTVDPVDAAVESLRQRDIYNDADSAVDRALHKINKRKSISNLTAGVTGAGAGTGAGTGAGAASGSDGEGSAAATAPQPAASASAAAPAAGEKKKTKEKARNAEGRLITQGHEQYALTYGMMLGIRVCTGRQNQPYSSPDSAAADNRASASSVSNMYALTEKEYNATTKLVFPPSGSSGGNGTIATPPHKLNFPFKFKDYATNAFRAIRALSNIDETDYILSLAGDFNYIEFIANSKSGQFFFYSHDGKYMIKTQTKAECKLLRKILPQYVSHLVENPNSLLVRFFGMHRVKMHGGVGKSIYFVIMSSVFDTEKPIHIKYDLKGSTVGRITSAASCAKGGVQKDRNLMDSGRVLYFGNLASTLKETLESDSAFLAKLNIMDYSLLVGIHDMRSKAQGRRHSSVLRPGSVGGDGSSGETMVPLHALNSTGGSLSAAPDALAPGEALPMTVFQSYCGGVRAAEGVYEIYFVGIIDILQLYNTHKRAETAMKSVQGPLLGYDWTEISSVDPVMYAKRFVRFLVGHTDYEEEEERKRQALEAAADEEGQAQGQGGQYGLADIDEEVAVVDEEPLHQHKGKDNGVDEEEDHGAAAALMDLPATQGSRSTANGLPPAPPAAEGRQVQVHAGGSSSSRAAAMGLHVDVSCTPGASATHNGSSRGTSSAVQGGSSDCSTGGMGGSSTTASTFTPNPSTAVNSAASPTGSKVPSMAAAAAAAASLSLPPAHKPHRGGPLSPSESFKPAQFAAVAGSPVAANPGSRGNTTGISRGASVGPGALRDAGGSRGMSNGAGAHSQSFNNGRSSSQGPDPESPCGLSGAGAGVTRRPFHDQSGLGAGAAAAQSTAPAVAAGRVSNGGGGGLMGSIQQSMGTAPTSTAQLPLSLKLRQMQMAEALAQQPHHGQQNGSALMPAAAPYTPTRFQAILKAQQQRPQHNGAPMNTSSSTRDGRHLPPGSGTGGAGGSNGVDSGVSRGSASHDRG